MASILRAPDLEALFARSVVAFAVDEPIDDPSLLHHDERRATTTFADGRRAEFTAGRLCARAALDVLRVDGPVRRGDAGQPVWPEGTTGSITHTTRWIASVVAQVDDGTSIGVDAEQISRLSPAVQGRIVTEAEERALGRLKGEDRQRMAATVFAVKEAFYKAHYQRHGRWLPFSVISVEGLEEAASADPAIGWLTVRAEASTVTSADAEAATIGWMHRGDMVIAAVTMRPVHVRHVGDQR